MNFTPASSREKLARTFHTTSIEDLVVEIDHLIAGAAENGFLSLSVRGMFPPECFTLLHEAGYRATYDEVTNKSHIHWDHTLSHHKRS